MPMKGEVLPVRSGRIAPQESASRFGSHRRCPFGWCHEPAGFPPGPWAAGRGPRRQGVLHRWGLDPCRGLSPGCRPGSRSAGAAAKAAGGPFSAVSTDSVLATDLFIRRSLSKSPMLSMGPSSNSVPTASRARSKTIH